MAVPLLGKVVLAALALGSAGAAALLSAGTQGASPEPSAVPAAMAASPAPAAAAPATTPRQVRGLTADNVVHNFYFTRGRYSGSRSWATDAPDADYWIADVMRRLTAIDVYPREHVVSLADPDLRRFPFVYILEVGGMRMTQAEVDGLRSYLLHGGFLMVDDFWGSWEWANWEREIRRVLPEYEIVDVPLDHLIFSTMYRVDEIVQVPGVQQARSGYTGQRDGDVPYVKGIFDEKGRLMVVINWNTDLGDAWEWAEAAYYPLHYSTYAYQVAANTFIYALTH